jgi:hypothetical protein
MQTSGSKAALQDGVASVLIDSEVRTSEAQIPTNFGIGTLAHDPEKWAPVFGKDHA